MVKMWIKYGSSLLSIFFLGAAVKDIECLKRTIQSLAILYPTERDGKSLGSCVNDLKRTIDLYTLGNWGCAITR